MSTAGDAMKRALFSLIVLFLSACSTQATPLRVIALTDFHGALESHMQNLPGGQTIEVGGATLLTTYVKMLRESDNIPTVIVDGGDLFQGTLVSNSAEGAP